MIYKKLTILLAFISLIIVILNAQDVTSSKETIPCEDKSKEYEVIGGSATEHYTYTSYHEPTAETFKSAAKNKCERQILIKSATKNVDCVTYCSQWECNSQYTHGPIICQNATNKNIYSHKDTNNQKWETIVYESTGSLDDAKCNCKTKDKKGDKV